MERAAKYAYTVYKERSFSAAAKVLFLSQPSLSITVGALEKELGFRIFDRTTLPLSLTPEGQIYMDSLEKIMEVEHAMHDRINRLSNLTYGSLSIGGSSFITYQLFPLLCGAFYKQYPDIQLQVDMGTVGPVSNLYDKLMQQSLELLFTYDFDPKEHCAIPLFEERIVIAMRWDLPGADALKCFSVSREALLSRKFSAEQEIEDLTVFSKIPFLRIGKGNNTYRQAAEFMDSCEEATCQIVNARHLDVHYHMMRSGLGAVLTTDSVIASVPEGKTEILYFVPKHPNFRRTLSVVYKRGIAPTNIARRFIDMAENLCHSGDLLFSGL